MKGFRDRPFSLPCGKCVGCRVDRARTWAARIVHESQMHEKNSFITLTYSKEHVPSDGSLNVAHWQNFAKWLRKKRGPFRFFHCGEYGRENLRPHYHACLFGEDFGRDRVLFKRTRSSTLFRSKLLEETWGKGFCTVGELTYDSARYVASYCVKKLSSGDSGKYERFDSSTGEVWSVRPEYVTMSRNPGIGSTWYDKFSGDIFPRDEVVIKGRKVKVPRFYLSRLDRESPELVEKIRLQRRERMEKRRDDVSPQALLRKERVEEEKVRVFKRELEE